MFRDIADKLGGCVVVGTLMSVPYKTAHNWYERDRVPVRQREKFISVCKRHGIKVTFIELAKKGDIS